MRADSILIASCALLVSPLLVEATAQTDAKRAKPSSAPRSNQVKRPSGAAIRSNFLKNYLPDVPGLSDKLGGGAGATEQPGVTTPSPLDANHRDPNTYQKKRQVAGPTAPKARHPAKPMVKTPVPSTPGRARRDRTYVSGVVPQSPLYQGPEGSRIRREPDPRAASARTAPTRSKSIRPPRRSFAPSSRSAR